MKYRVLMAAVAVAASTSSAFAGSHAGGGEWVCTDVQGQRQCVVNAAPNRPAPLINTTIVYVKGTDKRAGRQAIPQAPLFGPAMAPNGITGSGF